jgi:hypothetical protein
MESGHPVSTISKGMVRFAGNTYRIIKRDTVHEIVRVLDDVAVGSFRREPELELVECRIERDVALAIARLALHTGRLSYQAERDVPRGAVGDWLSTFRWNDVPSAVMVMGLAHQLLAA